MNKIITISRQYGSGGRQIGRMTAERLGIPCYDHDIIERTAMDSGFTKEYIAEHGEDRSPTAWLDGAFGGSEMNGGMSNSDVVWVSQRKAILELASQGPCVFVGRCADYILKDTAKLINVFIHADYPIREKRIVEVYGETDEAPEKLLRTKDRRRAAYYKYYAETEWGVAKYYTICLDSGELGLERCADILADLYRNTD